MRPIEFERYAQLGTLLDLTTTWYNAHFKLSFFAKRTASTTHSEIIMDCFIDDILCSSPDPENSGLLIIKKKKLFG